MAAKSVAFAVAEEDMPVLEQLVEQFGGGNRSEFLRQAMKRMRHEAWAEKMGGIQSKAHAEMGRAATREEIEAAIRAGAKERRA